jgi:nucleoside-diphosphate-sugar epimerase
MLTGAAGFLGSNLARELLRQGADVHVLLRESSDPWRIADVSSRLTVHRADVGDAVAVDAALAAARPQVLFHLAVPPGHPRDRDGRERMLRTLVLGTAHVLEAASVQGVARVVHLGSFLEYGPRGRPARETDPLDPVTARGAAKAAATLWCREFARASGLSAVVLRVFSVYGPWEDGGRLIPTAVRAALERRPLRLTAAAPRRDYVFVEDVVRACVLAACAEVSQGEVVNVGTGVLASNREVIAAVEAACGCRIEVAGEYPAQPADASGCAADVEKAGSVLGWQPRYALAQGIEATVAWFRERGGHPGSAGAAAGTAESDGEP